MPLNRKYPIAELLAACRRYLDKAPRDFITFEYCMLDGVNDSEAQARELVALVRGAGDALACKFNLIPFNPFPASGLHALAARARAGVRRGAARRRRSSTTVRKTRGDDIAAACGQLAGEVQDRTSVAERMTRAPVQVHRADSPRPGRCGRAQRFAAAGRCVRDDAIDADSSMACSARAVARRPRWRVASTPDRPVTASVGDGRDRVTASDESDAQQARAACAWSSPRPTSAGAR